MTGGLDKSDCTMESRCRSEGRPSLPRRRVATKTSHEYGDFETDLSLAIKESLKYAKEREGHLKEVEKTSPLSNCVKTEESFSRMAGKMLTFASSSDQEHATEETQQLKELLLIHIELIQHQQELLTTKDKEIRQLRNEKDALQCRLQRAEKRLAQMKQKEDFLETQIVKDLSTAVDEITAPVRQSEKGRSPSKPEQTPGRKRKRKQLSKAKRLTKLKKHTSEVNRTCESVTSEEHDSDGERNESSYDEEDEDDSQSRDTVVDGKPSERDSREGEDTVDEDKENKNGSSAAEEEEDRDPHPDPVLQTDCMYHIAYRLEMPPEELDDLQDEKEVTIGDKVETPGWRINVFTNRYQLEGTENITDEAYQKRHLKHEMEEKRRKRWDIQRMRDQQAFEKLHGKEEATACAAESEENLKTFLPCIDVTHVEISESVPVMAFGQTVLHIEPSEFELPWDTGPSSSFTRRSHGGRGRQK